jgi:serine/threonine-protein kinase
MNADRNLLFGILALQMDFIDRGALIAAMNAWVLAKGQPLGQILLAQGKLSHEHLQLLDALVAAHLRAHGGDADRSLAALSSVGSIRQDLQAVADPDVQASLARTRSATTDPDATGPYVLRTAEGTAAVQRYRILRPHARGGLGEVFVAADQELHREVALKEIQERLAHDAENRSRFVREAEITGGLEHPGIVPVYGMGHYADGRPFYAMRFIKGDSLKEAIQQFHKRPANDGPESFAVSSARNLEFRQLLRRFIDVCNAIAYAHSRGVLHRDVKPGNIMLGRFGETLIIDWGLAKASGQANTASRVDESTLHPSSGDGPTATVMGTALGTPAYMSPEQAAGRLDLLGPASDTYSLGATLYAVLTGRAPFLEDEAGEVLAKVQRGDFPAPRQLQPAVPAALQAVCLKAMALRPGDRYGSPRELANEIEHWLADEPVAAFPETRWARAGRWARRHRPLVSGVAAALLVAAMGLLGATLLLSVANRRERELKELAQRQEREAEEQRDKARANFQMARDAVDQYCTKVSSDARLKEQDLSELRQQLLQTAVQFYQNFALQHAQDPELQLELGRAYCRLGALYTSLDKHEEAVKLCRQALEVIKPLLAASPDEVAYQYELASILMDLEEPLAFVGNRAESAQILKQAIDLLEPLARSHPDDLIYGRDLGRAYGNLGERVRQQGELQAAETWIRKAIEPLAELRKQFPADEKLLHVLAFQYQSLANTLRITGRIHDGIVAAQNGLHLWSELTALNPKDPYYRQHHGITLQLQAMLHEQAGDLNLADKAFHQVIEINRGLTDRYPGIPQYQFDLAVSYMNYGSLMSSMHRPEQAIVNISLAVPIFEKLVEQNPYLEFRDASLIGALVELGKCYFQGKREDKAYATWLKAVPHLRHVTCNTLRGAGAHLGLANSLSLMAGRLADKGDLPGAIDQTKVQISIREKLAGRTKPQADDFYALGAAQGALASLLYRAKKPGEALNWAKKAERTLDGVPKGDKRLNQNAQQELLKTLRTQAAAFDELKRHGEALAVFDRALKKASGDEQTPLRVQRALASVRSGDHRRAAMEAEDLIKVPRLEATALYDLARTFALSAALAAKDLKLSEAERLKIAAMDTDQALKALRQAIQNGYQDAANVKSDPDLHPLRARDAFRKLQAELEAKVQQKAK